MAVASISVASWATSEVPRIAVVEPPANLLDAASVALSPWGLHVVPISARAPASADVSAALVTARAISQEHHAAVLIWIAAANGEPSLWLYDAQTEQVSIRPLQEAPPFDEASAAAVALTIKTLLRSTNMAPVKERMLAAPAAPRTVDGGATDAAASVSALPSASDAGPASSTPPLVAAPDVGTSHALRAEALVTAHLPTGTGEQVTPRAGVSMAYFPRVWHERVGLGAAVLAGPNQDVSSGGFNGSLSDTVVALTVRGRLGNDPLSIEGAMGPSLHVTSLSGTVLGSAHATSIQRGDPALDASVVPQVLVGSRLRVGLFLGTSVLMRTQRYTVGQDLVLKLPLVGFDIGGRASVALD